MYVLIGFNFILPKVNTEYIRQAFGRIVCYTIMLILFSFLLQMHNDKSKTTSLLFTWQNHGNAINKTANNVTTFTSAEGSKEGGCEVQKRVP